MDALDSASLHFLGCIRRRSWAESPTFTDATHTRGGARRRPRAARGGGTIASAVPGQGAGRGDAPGWRFLPPALARGRGEGGGGAAACRPTADAGLQ